MMDSSTASSLETQMLLQQAQSYASLLSLKLAVLAQQYDSEAKSSSTTLRQENRILRQELEQLRQKSAIAVEQQPVPRDRLGEDVAPRCFEEDVHHFAPPPVKAKDQEKEPSLVTVRVDGPEEGRTLKVHARDCNRIRDLSTAPSPKDLWNAVAFDSGEDFKTRMPRRLRPSQIDRLNVQQQLEWSAVESNPSSPEKSLSMSGKRESGKREKSSMRGRSEMEVEGVRQAVDASSSIDTNGFVPAPVVRNSGMQPRSSASQVNEDPPAPMTPARLPSVRSNASPVLSSSESDQVKCRSCGNTGKDFMGNMCSCPYGKVVERARSADQHSRSSGQSRGCLTPASDHGPHSAQALLLQPPPSPVVNVLHPSGLGDRRSLSERRSSRTPRNSRRGGSPSSFFSFSRMTPRAPPSEKGPEPVKALSKQVQSTDEGRSSVWSTHSSMQRKTSPGGSSAQEEWSSSRELAQQQEASAASGATSRGLVRIESKGEIIKTESAASKRGSTLSLDSNPWRGMPSSASRVSQYGSTNFGGYGRHDSHMGAGTGLFGEEKRDQEGNMKPAYSRLSTSSMFSCLEDNPLRIWPIWRWDKSERYLAHLQNRGTITRSFMKLAARDPRQRRGDGEFTRVNSEPRRVPAKRRWEKRMACIMVHPRHPKMSVWHLLGSLLIMYDVFMIPLDSFQLPDSYWNIVMVWLISCYWSADFILQFFLGYENELGQVEVRPSEVAKHYLRTWFLPDAIIVTFDWLSFLVFDLAGSSRSTRIRRALRALRILRVLKLSKLVGRILDRVMTENIRILAKVFMLLLLVFGVTHYMGCFWYFIGDQDFAQAQTTWLTSEEGETFDFWRLYTVSLQWSVAQAGFSPTEIYPTSTLERIYVIFAGFMWLILLPLMVSKVTVWMLGLKDSNREGAMQETMIRKYLKDNCVSTDLCEEVVRFCRKFSQSRARRVHTPDIVIFEDLPLELRVSVHRQVFMPILTSHPLFEAFLQVNEAAVVAACHLAMEEHYYRAGSEVFTHGEEAAFMAFVLCGELEYFTVKNDYEPTVIGVAEWICEPVLWRRWICRGRLVAKSSSELVSLNARKFHAILEEGEDKGWTVDLLRNYAEEVTAHFDHIDPNTDIWNQGENLSEIVEQSWARTYTDDPHALQSGSSSTSIGTMRKHLKQRLNDK